MPVIFDLLYREYCRARLAEMRKQLLISPKRREVPDAFCDAKDGVGAKAYSLMSIEGLMKTVWIYVDTSKPVGDAEHAKVFATMDAAETWFKENDAEGVAFEYEVLE